jgi:hypothetical protein
MEVEVIPRYVSDDDGEVRAGNSVERQSVVYVWENVVTVDQTTRLNLPEDNFGNYKFILAPG